MKLILLPTVAANLRRMRAKEGLSQEQLANRAAITAGYIARIEQERCSPSFAIVERLAQAMGRSPLELFRRMP